MMPVLLALSVTSLLSLVSDARGISGEWKSECFPLPRRHSIIFDAHFSEGKLNALSQLYAETGSCTTLNLLMTIQGDYYLGAASGEGHEIDFTPKSIVIELKRPEVVDFYNARKACGFSDWTLFVSKEILGKPCDPSIIPDVQGRSLDIYNISDEGDLFFGAFPFSAPRERPLRLNRSFSLSYTAPFAFESSRPDHKKKPTSL